MHEGTSGPSARSDGLLVEVMGDELLVFDTERQVAHSLNDTAARVWRACDGRHGPEALMAACNVDEPTLSLALERLEGVDLLQGTTAQPPRFAASDGVSRRAMLRKTVLTGAGIGVAIPVIRSITVPSVAMASSTARNAKNGATCVQGGPAGQCSPGSVCSVSTNKCYRPHGGACFHGATAGSTSQCFFAVPCPAGGTCA